MITTNAILTALRNLPVTEPVVVARETPDEILALSKKIYAWMINEEEGNEVHCDKVETESFLDESVPKYIAARSERLSALEDNRKKLLEKIDNLQPLVKAAREDAEQFEQSPLYEGTCYGELDKYGPATAKFDELPEYQRFNRIKDCVYGWKKKPQGNLHIITNE